MKLKVLFTSLFVILCFACIEDKGLLRELPPISNNSDAYDLSKAMNVNLGRDNQIFVNNSKVDIQELKNKIHEYYIKNKSESIISIQNERETSYEAYINVQNAVVSELANLREQLSREKYNLSFDNLSEEQIALIKKIYPLNLVE